MRGSLTLKSLFYRQCILIAGCSTDPDKDQSAAGEGGLGIIRGNKLG